MLNLSTMYPPQANSPTVDTVSGMTTSDTTVTVTNGDILPSAPCLLVLGSDTDNPETVLMTAKSGNILTLQRAVEGTAQAWLAQTNIARLFTAADLQAVQANISALNTGKADGTALTDHIDDTANPHGVTAAQAGALPLTGGELTGSVLKLNSGTGAIGSYGTAEAGSNTALTIFKRANDDANKRTLNLWAGTSDISAALRFRDYTDGVQTDYNIFHTGNKPSGSYTGNGDATSRTINTGGIGNFCLVYRQSAITLVTPAGGACFDTVKASVTYFSASELKFANGDLTIATASALVNMVSGQDPYYYQVL